MPERVPPASLIICSRNRPELLAETVESVLAGNTVPAEIVIVDQSERPNPRLQQLRPDRTEIRYFKTETVGTSRARNIGSIAAQHPILAFVDDDMHAAPEWFSALIGVLAAAGPKCVVTGQVRPADPVPPGHFVPSIKTDSSPSVYRGRVWQDALYSNNMALFRSALSEIGGFDERLGGGTRFPAAEDNDCGYRLLERGYQILYVPSAIMYHRAWRPMRAYIPLRWNYGRGQGGFYAKHLNNRDLYIGRRLRRDLGSYLMRAIFRLPHDRVRAFGDAVYAAGICCGAIHWLAAQGTSKLHNQLRKTACGSIPAAARRQEPK